MQGLDIQAVVDALRELEDPVDWYNDYDSVFRRGYTYQRSMDNPNFDIPEFKVLRDFIEVHVQNPV